MTQNHTRLSWVEKEAKRDQMKLSERGGETASLIGVVLVTLFFYAHQARSTGFFLTSFGSLESFLLYGSIFFGVIGPLARVATGRRNLARPPEIIASIFWIVASIWLLVVFPFDFAHFADIVPDFLRFLITWVTDDIAMILFILGILGGIAFIVTSAILYWKVGTLLSSHNESS